MALPTAYDAPRRILDNILEGEFSVSGAWNTVWNPATLSPKELSGPIARMKQAAGGNPVTDFMVDLATNPLTWLFFVSEPLAKSAGGFLQKPAKHLSAYVADKAPFLGAFLGPAQVLDGSNAVAVGRHLHEGILDFEAMPEFRAKRAAENRVAQKLGVDSLDWRQVGGVQGDKVKRLMLAVQGKMEGWDRDFTRTYIAGYDGDKGQWIKKKGVVERKVQADLGAVIDEFGQEGRDLHKSYVDFLEASRKRLFGDEDQIIRTFRYLRAPKDVMFRVGDRNTAQPTEMIGTLLGDIADAVANGSLQEQQKFHRMVKEYIQSVGEEAATNGYFPRNIVESYQAGENVTGLGRVSSQVRAIRPGTQMHNRISVEGRYHPDDLRALKEEFGATPALDKQIQLTAEQIEKAAGTLNVLRMNPSQSIERYSRSAARTWTLTRSAPQDLLHLYGESLKESEGVTGKLAGIKDVEYFPGAKDIASVNQHPLEAIAEGTAPPGGYSVFDMAYGDVVRIPNEFRRAVYTNTVIPKMLGLVDTPTGILGSLPPLYQHLGRWFTSSPVGKYLKEQGGFTADWMKALENFSNRELSPGDLGAPSRTLATILYASHLGFNVGSALINMLQPMLLLAPRYGMKAVAKGYAETLKDVGAFWEARSAQGFRSLTPLERQETVQNAFRLMGGKNGWTPGENLLGISDPSVEIFEHTGKLAADGRNPLVPKKGLWHYMTRAPLAMFGATEYMNRSVAGYAAAHSIAEGAGVTVEQLLRNGGVLGARAKDAIYKTVGGTQFITNPLFQPLFMQAGDTERAAFGGAGVGVPFALNTPPSRQFLSFPWRSFLANTYDASRLAGREGVQRVVGPGMDFLRGMAYSAVVYEAGKNLLGQDLSRGLYWSSVTDLIPGVSQGRLSNQDSLPFVPPAVDMGIDLTKGLLAGDKDLLAQTLWRVVPGGLALSRAMGTMPKLPVFQDLQRTYADWNAPTPDGNIPVYGGDGTLKGVFQKSTLLLRAAGLDFSQFKDEGEVTNWLVKNREEMGQFRNQYLQAVTSGDYSGADRVSNEYQRKFGMKLQVSKAQLGSYSMRLTTPRVTRALNRIPQESRGEYLAAIQGMNPSFSLEGPPKTDPGLDVQRREPFGSFEPY